jgi:hypothetical protein
MAIKQYDRVLLRTGESAYIVEILGGDACYVADVDTDGGTITKFVYSGEIETVL